MNPISYQEAFQALRREGFGEAEIDRLYRLRRGYLTSELDQPPLDLNRLQFVRWLVTAGRLTDSPPKSNRELRLPTRLDGLSSSSCLPAFCAVR